MAGFIGLWFWSKYLAFFMAIVGACPEVTLICPMVVSCCQVATVASPPPDKVKTVNTDNKVIFKPGRCFMFTVLCAGVFLPAHNGGLWF